jgi:glycosyltransferase involved in cell wall biosynthesis
MGSLADHYFQRFGFCARQILHPPASDLGLVVVIPCFNEPDLIGSLDSLWACDRPACGVEVIVVINASCDSSPESHAQNERTYREATQWISNHLDPKLAFYCLHFPTLPAKRAGVGLARKIGMDEAVGRLGEVTTEGVVACYDADCRCDRNYLTAMAQHFHKHSRCPACSIYFEHPLEGPLEATVYEAAVSYELHLRYYVQALRFAGVPWAYHTVGSCLAVRADVYMAQGGMNQRQAGEDFYFLQKIIPLGGFLDLTETRVMPSPRPSDRVPFGTGRAVRTHRMGETFTTYPLEVFLDLKRFLEQRPPWRRAEESSKAHPWSPAVQTFLQAQGFEEALQEMRENTSSDAAFGKRFFRWFNGFRVLKFVHHARDCFYGPRPVKTESARLLSLRMGPDNEATDLSSRALLERYRQWDRQDEYGRRAVD